MIIDKSAIKIETKNLSVSFGNVHAITNVSLNMLRNKVTAIIGPSGCGKSTFIKALNRMNELVSSARTEGEVLIDGKNIYDDDYDVISLRKKVGMIFQKPNPFPKSIYDNVAYGPRIHGFYGKKELNKIVEENLRKAFLWDEVSDRLNASALDLSGGQQQRLCISRALAVEPEVILMDEPCSALDPVATAKIEELIRVLRNDYSIVIVTHNMQQAARVSDFTSFLYLGKLIEYGSTNDIFENPKSELTEKYLTGKFG
jgi:phosphate transport system ATP-binding protein